MSLCRLLTGCFLFCFLVGSLSAGTIFQGFEPKRLEIRNHPLEVENNSARPYRFVLSVLGVHEQEFIPLLAIVLDPEDLTTNQWIAVWNLSTTAPGFMQRVKAVLPFPWWSPRGSAGGTLEPVPETTQARLDGP